MTKVCALDSALKKMHSRQWYRVRTSLKASRRASPIAKKELEGPFASTPPKNRLTANKDGQIVEQIRQLIKCDKGNMPFCKGLLLNEISLHVANCRMIEKSPSTRSKMHPCILSTIRVKSHVHHALTNVYTVV